MQEYKTKSTSEKCQNCYYHYCNENNRYGCKRFANTECPGVSNFITLRTFRFENFFGGPSTSLSWSEFTAQPIKSQFELCTRRRTLGGVYRKFVRSRWLSISTQKFWARIFKVKSCLSMPFESLIATSRNCKCNFV